MPDNPNYASYRMTVTVLTPVHIGTGRELLNEYDYAVSAGQTWRINDAALLEAQEVEDPAIAERLAQTPPAQLLHSADFTPGSPYFRYVIKGTPRSRAEGAQVREQLKDTFDQLYLPGSCLKGALRTALGWHGWGERGLKPDFQQLRPSPRFAAQNYERQIFVDPAARQGHEPNYDLLKAFQVSDSRPVSADHLMLVNATVINRAGRFGSQIPVELEAIRSNIIFVATLKFDLALFSSWAQKHNLHLPGEAWLRSLPQICRDYAAQRIRQEIAWFGSIPSAKRLLNAYQQLGGAMLAGNQFLLQIGWGTGWDSKTLGSRLTVSRDFMEAIIQKHNMSRGKWQKGDPFPKSRRAVMVVAQSPDGQRSETPAVPLGWVLVTLEPLHEPIGWLELAGKTEPLLQAGQIQPPVVSPAARPEENGKPETRDAAQELPPRPPLVKSFSASPKPGDRFEGIIFSLEGRTALIELPGMDPDTQAYGVVGPEDNPGGTRLRENQVVACEVIAVEQERKNYLRVHCRPVD